MKKIVNCALCVLLILTSFSCKESPRGGWERVRLDKYEVTVGLDGGEDIITVINYPTIRISKIESINQAIAPSDGISVKCEEDRICIKVNASKTPQSWKVTVNCYDASCDPIFVYQK